MSIAPCPICKSNDTSEKFTFSASDAAQTWVLREQKPHEHARLVQCIQRLWNGDEGSIRRCDECDFEFAAPFKAGDEEFYSLAFGSSGYPADKWEFKRTIEALSGRDMTKLKVLELGAGGGFFIDKLIAHRVKPENISFTEYNVHTIPKLEAKGAKFSSDHDLIHKMRGELFDLIVMFQVLEHRDDILKLFALLRHLSKPGADIILAVPNRRRTDYHEGANSLLDMPPTHISRWSSSAAKRLAERTGFEFLRAEPQPFDFVAFVRQDLIFSHMRRAQVGRSLPSFLYTRRKHALWRVVNVLVACAMGVTRIPYWWKAAPAFRELGSSFWVHYRKPL